MIYYRTSKNGIIALHDASNLSKFDGKLTTADLSKTTVEIRQWNDRYHEFDLETAHSLRGGNLKPDLNISEIKINDVYKEIYGRDNFGLVEFYFSHNGVGYASTIQNTNLGYSFRTSVDNQPVPSFILGASATLAAIVQQCEI